MLSLCRFQTINKWKLWKQYSRNKNKEEYILIASFL